MKQLFHGPVVVLASGPSLTEEDIRAVSGLPKIAVNTTWEKVRDCDVLFAGDNRWWQNNTVDIDCIRASLSYNAERKHGAKKFKSKVAKKHGYNSGCIAIEYAIRHGAKRVILLGFDCSLKHGIHHHGKHQNTPNPHPGRISFWHGQFKRLADIYRCADIVNCSRYTELDCFPRMPLEKALDSLAEPPLHRPRETESVCDGSKTSRVRSKKRASKRKRKRSARDMEQDRAC